MYFNNKINIYLNKKEVKIRVSIKEKEPHITVSYCFGINKENIINEIKKEGNSRISEFIEEKIKNRECFCETKNPSGRCCLNNVKSLIMSMKRLSCQLIFLNKSFLIIIV